MSYRLIILITGATIPIACSLLRFLPFPSILASRFNAYFIEPPIFGRRHQEPFRNLALVPTRGQAILIAYFIIINIVLSCIDYTPDTKGDQHRLLGYIRNRQGVLCFANLPLLLLYSSRNNLLLWITNWSHSTFLLVHRWIAIILTIEACIHSAITLQRNLDDYSYQSKLPYWIWGVVAVMSMSILLPASILPIRQRLYNIFLISHFVLAFMALIGCYYHINQLYENQWGYETWIYTAFGIWAFDRAARLARLARYGVKTAEVTIVDEDYIRVDIHGVVAQGHAYLYFPTLSWRVWENHPFSVMGAMKAQETHNAQSPKNITGNSKSSTPDLEKTQAYTRASTTSSDLAGFTPPKQTASIFKPCLTFFVRTTEKGLTNSLRSKKTLPVLIESSYAASSLEELHTVPNCVVIAGGVGLSAVGPLLRTRGTGRVRLFWGVRSQPLREAVEASLGPEVLVPNIVGEIAVGKRLDLRAIIEREAVNDIETAVVVCGPVGMADEVREIVCQLGRKGRVIKLIDEAFSW